jgi:antitoxin component YwqK of YwqJK toxin-antitoxin module
MDYLLRNGQIEHDIYYKDGSKDGKWTYYNEDGNDKRSKRVLTNNYN